MIGIFSSKESLRGGRDLADGLGLKAPFAPTNLTATATTGWIIIALLVGIAAVGTGLRRAIHVMVARNNEDVLDQGVNRRGILTPLGG